MAIVLKYGSPGPILAAGFAAGVGNRQNEQQDDALKIWQQQQQQNFQAEQAKLGRDFQAGQQALEQGFRAGEAGLQRGFQEKQWGLERDFRSGQQGREFDERTFFNLPQIPEYADADSRRKLSDDRAVIRDLLSRNFDRSDPAVQKKLQEAINSYTSGVETIRGSYSPAGEANRHTIYRDQRGVAFDEPGEGRTPFDSRTGQPLLEDQATAQAKQAGEQMKQTEKYQAANDKYFDRMQKLAQSMADADIQEGQPVKPWTDFEDQAKELLKKHGITQPQMPGQPAAQPAPGGVPPARAGVPPARAGVPPAPGGVPPAWKLGGVRPAPQPGATALPTRQISPAAQQRVESQLQAVANVQADELARKWAALKVGQGMPGPDGRVSIKRSVSQPVPGQATQQPNGLAAKAEDLPARSRSKLARPRTREEIAALTKQYGPGVEFEWTDGRVYRTK